MSVPGPAWRMPPEWGRHDRIWMAWPVSRWVLAGDSEGAYRAWAAVANAIVDFEPVTMVTDIDAGARARGYLDPRIGIIEHAIGESWMRDSGPTFVVGEDGRLGAVDWSFNGWGGRTFPEGAADALVARFIAGEADAVRVPSHLVNEGGGIHVDGEGTLLVTETVQLNPNRNPNWDKAAVEAELRRTLGVEAIIWLPSGLAADRDETGTDGHIDTLACFVRPGTVLVHGQPDPSHPDYAIARENTAILRASRDAAGRALEVIVIDAPAPKRGPGGDALSCTYVNFAFVNGGIIMGTFDDPQDEVAADLFRRLWPERAIVPVPATRIFEGGGGVHCITQQQPVSGN